MALRAAQVKMAVLFAVLGGSDQSAPVVLHDVVLWRLDCGRMAVKDFGPFSDTHRYDGKRRGLVASCYLIKNGPSYMLWDAGLDGRLAGLRRGQDDGEMILRLDRKITTQLAAIGVRPSMVGYVGISHYHDDHTGQAGDFPRATLLVGASDWSAVRAGSPEAMPADGLTPWLAGGGTVLAVSGDLDVFGDGNVIMLATPGHTPVHHSLLIRLPRTGWILLSGDQFHSRESFRNDQVPTFNSDRVATVASTARLRRIMAELHARLIIAHEPVDVGMLPILPRHAR